MRCVRTQVVSWVHILVHGGERVPQRRPGARESPTVSLSSELLVLVSALESRVVLLLMLVLELHESGLGGRRRGLKALVLVHVGGARGRLAPPAPRTEGVREVQRGLAVVSHF